MATGAGKTFTAITAVYRLLKHARVRRVLFLVDITLTALEPISSSRLRRLMLPAPISHSLT
jgi:hypothetical protein